MNCYLLFLICYLFTHVGIYLPMGIAPEEVLIVILLPVLLLKRNAHVVKFPKPILFAFTVFLALSVISTLRNPYELDISIIMIAKVYVSRLILFVFLVNWPCRDPLNSWLSAMKIFSFLVALLCILVLLNSGLQGFRYYVYSDTLFSKFLRTTMIFNPSTRSIDFLLILLFSHYMFRITRKSLWLVFVGFWTFFIILNGSRMGLIGLLLAAAYIFYKEKRSYKIVFPLLLLSVILGFGIAKHAIDMKLAQYKSPLGVDLRLALLKVNLEYIPKQLWLGAGVESSKQLLISSYDLNYYYKEIKGKELGDEGLAQHADILRLLLENGVLGLLAAIMVILGYMSALFRYRARAIFREVRSFDEMVLFLLFLLLVMSCAQVVIGLNSIYLFLSLPFAIRNKQYRQKVTMDFHKVNVVRYAIT